MKFFKEELFKAFLTTVATLIGVYYAFHWTLSDERNRDEDSYLAMVRAINSEAKNNYHVYHQRFNYYNIDSSITDFGFILKQSEAILTDKNFLSKAPENLSINFNDYYLNLSRANTFKGAVERYRYDSVLNNKWGVRLRIVIEKIMLLCRSNIEDLINTTDSILRKEK